MKDIVCIGHVTLDKIVTPEKEVYMPGGTTYYFAHGMSSLNNDTVSFQLVASLAESEMKAVDDMRSKGIDVKVINSRKSVFFENIYGANQNDRQQRVRAKADPFTIDSVQGIEAKYICLGSLLADDFPLDVVKYLSQHGTIVMDAQGYLREVRGEEVFACDWKDKLEYFKYIDILKVNEQEIATLTGISDYHEAARQLAAWGIKEVLLTLGSEGSLLLVDGEFYEVPAVQPRRVVDATGCGDTFTMGYVYKRVQGASPADAAAFAALVSARKLEDHGPFKGNL
ncbi:MAG: PfkB family carbohydrate kinase [Bacteroidaceae bacterium]|nr:PfkB family carbohydrate kinase [Bacteroidaceae bacterium]